MTAPRKTLATYGSRGDAVRVFVERGGELVRVQWSAGPRGAKKLQTKSWAHTAANVRDAKAWAKGFSETRSRGGAVVEVPTLTLRALWERYTVAEFPHLRPATITSYSAHWKLWEVFVGRAFVAERTTLEMVDDFRRHRERQGAAVNQVRETIKVVKLVYRFGERRELLSRNRTALYRFKIAKEARPAEIAEYDPSAFPKILAQFDPRDVRRWRAWAITAVLGTMGPRINALLHLRWDDVDFDENTVTWRARFDKMGHERTQPMPPLAREALLVALGWSRFDRGASGWVFYTSKVSRQANADLTYHVSAYWRMLTDAETAAGVDHLARRAAHGWRRMAAGNVNAMTGDAVVAMQWIGDKDLRMAQRYLKKRDETMAGVAARIGDAPEVRDGLTHEPVTEPQSPENGAGAASETAPATTTHTTTYDG